MSLDQDVIAELETIVDTKYVRTAAVIWSPSSGMISRRQSRTFFPRAAAATAVAESKTTAPTAAQGAGPVYALDAVELDVAGRRGAGDPGERAVRAQPREGGRHVVDDVLGAHQADACVGHQRVRTPPAQRAALQNDRAGLGHADHASGEHGIDRSKSATDSGASRSSGTRVTPELGRPAIRQPGRNRPGRVPPIPRDGGALRPIERPWAGRLPLLSGQSCTPLGHAIGGVRGDEASTGVHSRSAHPGLPLRLWAPDGTGLLGLIT